MLAFTNRPVDALRFTVRLLRVPRPTRSVVVRPGHLAVAVRETNRPVRALREMLRPRAMTILRSENYTPVIPELSTG